VKLPNIAGAALVAIGLAACASTQVTPPTASPTLAPTVAPSAAPTPTATPEPKATPIPLTPTPMPGVYVTVTCSNVPVMWAQKPFPKGSI
jgi:glucose/arabinose dehydrogenase